jgi:uncharacterized membrane protein YhaH (DUF805 family)
MAPERGARRKDSLVNFPTAIKTVFTKYADFRGVATRSEYWWFALFSFLVSVVFNVLIGDPNDPNTVASGISLVWSLGILIPSIALAVRRFHDAGFSGKWLLLYLVPTILFVVAAASSIPVIIAAVSGTLTGDALAAEIAGILGVAVLPLITGFAMFVFNLVVSVLPSKSAANGNKYAV